MEIEPITVDGVSYPICLNPCYTGMEIERCYKSKVAKAVKVLILVILEWR